METMSLNRAQLVWALKQAMSGVAKSTSVVAGAEAFAFSEGSLRSFNNEISVHVPLKEVGFTSVPLDGTVVAKELFNLVNKFKGDTIDFTDDGNGAWELKCGRGKGILKKIANDNVTRYASSLQCSDDGWQALPIDFISGLKILFIPGNNSTVNGVCLTERKGISTDNIQVHEHNFRFEGEGIADSSFPLVWFSNNAVSHITKLSGLTHIQMTPDGSWCHFKTLDNVVISFRVLKADGNGGYPLQQLEEHLSVTQYKEGDFVATLPAQFLEVMTRAGSLVMEEEGTQIVHISLSQQGVVVKTEKASGSYEETIPWDTDVDEDMPEISVYASIDMLKAVIGRTSKFFIKKSFSLLMCFPTDSGMHILTTFTVTKGS